MKASRSRGCSGVFERMKLCSLMSSSISPGKGNLYVQMADRYSSRHNLPCAGLGQDSTIHKRGTKAPTKAKTGNWDRSPLRTGV